MNKNNDVGFDIVDVLGTGAEHAISTKTISAMTGFQERAITLMVMAKRREGVIICSNGDGYFLPKSPEESVATICNLKSREREIRITRRAMEKAVKKQTMHQITVNV